MAAKRKRYPTWAVGDLLRSKEEYFANFLGVVSSRDRRWIVVGWWRRGVQQTYQYVCSDNLNRQLLFQVADRISKKEARLLKLAYPEICDVPRPEE